MVEKGTRNIPGALGGQHRIAQFEHLRGQVEEFSIGDRIAFMHEGQQNSPGTGPGVSGFGGNFRQGHLPACAIEGAEHFKPPGERTHIVPRIQTTIVWIILEIG